MALMAAAFEPAAGLSATGATPPGAREPQLFRFGLRQLFAFVSGAVVLVGVMAMAGGSWAPTIGFLAALVAAHVLATSVGTRLRDTSSDIQQWKAGRPGASADPPPRTGPASPAVAMSASSLARHEETPRRSLSAALTGLIAGASLGAAGMPFVAGSQATPAGLALGAVSCGVICAWLALLVANFWTIARGAWREARMASGGYPAKRRRKRWWRRDDDPRT